MHRKFTFIHTLKLLGEALILTLVAVSDTKAQRAPNVSNVPLTFPSTFTIPLIASVSSSIYSNGWSNVFSSSTGKRESNEMFMPVSVSE